MADTDKTPEIADINKQTIEIKRIDRPIKKADQKSNDAKANELALDLAIKTKIQKYLNLGVPKSDIALMIPGWNLNGHGEMAQQFLLLSAPGKDIDAEPEEKYDTSPVLPEDAWTGLFAKYRSLVAGTTEASDNYHFGGFLTILGTTLKHTVSVYYAGRLYPNFYVCNIGRSGETRKTTAANRALRLCNKINFSDDEESQPFQILYQIGSIEALYDSLNGKKRTRLIFYSELGSLMAKAQQSGTSNIITDLTNLWDVPDRMNPSTRHIKVNCEQPFVSILACSTLEWLYKYISLENIYSGFANRWNFLYGEPKGPMPNPPQVSDNDERELLKDINQVRKWALSLPHEGVIGKSKEAEEMWDQFYIDYFNQQMTTTGMLPELMMRIPNFIWKIAMLYACQDCCATIRGKDLHRAIRVGKFLEQSIRAIFHGYANSEGRKKEEHLIDYLKKKGALPYRDIYRALNMSSKELMDIAKPLAQAGVICFRKIGTKDGITLL